MVSIDILVLFPHGHTWLSDRAKRVHYPARRLRGSLDVVEEAPSTTSVNIDDKADITHKKLSSVAKNGR